MKKAIVIVMAFGLFMMPFVVYSQPEQTTAQPPPIAPPLVREGDFAMKLVEALKIGTAQNEADAETMLGSSGIAPKNGWIADYPVTPDIIGELQNTVGVAADSKRLPMGKDEALEALQRVSGELGSSVFPDTSGKYSENQPPTASQYAEPTVINNYYYDEGPPVVTYYPPPWDYYYLYAWVPYPFWWGGFFFSGFFCLHDFHRVVVVGHHHFVFTNHVIDPVNKAVVRVDPASRRAGGSFRTADIPHQGRLNSAEARRGAASILERSRERSASVSGVERDRTGTVSSGSGNRTFRQPNNIERRNETNVRGSSGGEGKSLPAPSVTHERSFSAPSMGGRGSFGGFRAEGGTHSFGHSGFSSGAGHGGCRGHC